MARIIDYSTETKPISGDYFLVDNESSGTKKVPADDIAMKSDSVIQKYVAYEKVTEFMVSEGSAHSSLSDQIKMHIVSGEEYLVCVEAGEDVSLTRCEIYLYDSDGTTRTGALNLTTYSTNEMIPWTPVANGERIGLYTTGVYGTIKLIILKPGEILTEIDGIKKDLEHIDSDQLTPHTIGTVSKTIAHGAQSGTLIQFTAYTDKLSEAGKFMLKLSDPDGAITMYQLIIDNVYSNHLPDNTYTIQIENSIKAWIPANAYVKDENQETKGGTVTVELYTLPSVNTETIQEKAITSDKLADQAVTPDKLADQAVTPDKLANGSITPEKLDDVLSSTIYAMPYIIPSETSFMSSEMVCSVPEQYYVCTANGQSWKKSWTSDSFSVVPGDELYIYTGRLNVIGYTIAIVIYYDSNNEEVSRQDCVVVSHTSPAKDSYMRFKKVVPEDETIVSARLTGYVLSNGLQPAAVAGTTYYIEWIKVFKGKVRFTDEVTFDVPYVEAGAKRVANELKSKSDLGNIITFGFATDCHIYTENQTGAVLRGMDALSKMTKAYPYDFICLGGDNCHEGGYDNSLTELLWGVITVQKPLTDAACPVISITGNHDAFQNNNAMTGEMLFNAHFKRIANSGFLKGWDNKHTNGYWDSEAHKVRFIFYDDSPRSDYDATARSNALTTMLSTTPSGYKIVVFSHHVLNSSLSDSHWANPMAFQSVLSQYANKIICCICGHVHADVSETKDGILYIATTMAKYGTDADGNTRTLNTESETAFDTFVIDQVHNKIYAIRYGYGTNREWSYTVE